MALVRRYREAFVTGLGDPAHPSALDRVIASFRRPLEARDGMCLYGLLGAERDALPAAVADEVAQFFEDVGDWLKRAFASLGRPEPEVRASVALALLEGGLLVARALGDGTAFDRSAAHVRIALGEAPGPAPETAGAERTAPPRRPTRGRPRPRSRG